PMAVISKEQIQKMGSLRLTDVLQEQTGLAIVTDHGQGIQIQGFSPDYTLILIDGEPVIGRTAGTLELSRLAVGNIERIEIVKGPSSSLYGSEALAGVVNIITKKADSKSVELSSRYGTNQTLDLSTNLNYKEGGLTASLFLNRFSSEGYDFTPDTFGQTAEPFENYTAQGRLGYQFSDNLELSVSGRYFAETQDSRFDLGDEENEVLVGGEGTIRDFNVHPVLTWRINPKWKNELRLYASGYRTENNWNYLSDGEVFDATYFEQGFYRAENQTNFYPNEQNIFTFGAGYLHEDVEATRYDEKQIFRTVYAYLQHEFTPTDKWHIVTGARFDSQSVYGSQLSPKLAIQHDLSDRLSLRVSAGRGFKAPDFRQLYLNFTNSIVGYSVFGTEVYPEMIAELLETGQVEPSGILVPASEVGDIQAETSWSFNAGGTFKPVNKLNLNFNVFRNEVQNLIESQLVAVRTTGQSIFSYRNFNRIRTQGVELDATYQIHPNLRLAAGYQYLEAQDKEVLEQIDNEELFYRDPETLASVVVTRSDYGGLFGRSKHMFNVKAFYEHPKTGLSGNIRLIYRGRYGFGDRNGNLILDQDNEYVDGFLTTQIVVGKSIWEERARIQVGCDNLFNYRDEAFIPGLAGRLLWLQLQIQFSK
ncbi:MAG: TonB-dependent receptor, partial [Bacteroidota bacterium]